MPKPAVVTATAAAVLDKFDQVSDPNKMSKTDYKTLLEGLLDDLNGRLEAVNDELREETGARDTGQQGDAPGGRGTGRVPPGRITCRARTRPHRLPLCRLRRVSPSGSRGGVRARRATPMPWPAAPGRVDRRLDGLRDGGPVLRVGTRAPAWPSSATGAASRRGTDMPFGFLTPRAGSGRSDPCPRATGPRPRRLRHGPLPAVASPRRSSPSTDATCRNRTLGSNVSATISLRTTTPSRSRSSRGPSTATWASCGSSNGPPADRTEGHRRTKKKVLDQL